MMEKKIVYFATCHLRNGSTSHMEFRWADVFADIDSAKSGCKVAMNAIDVYGIAKPIEWKELEDGDWYGETMLQNLGCVFRIVARVL